MKPPGCPLHRPLHHSTKTGDEVSPIPAVIFDSSQSRAGRRIMFNAILLIFALIMSAGTARAAFIDENGNGLSDIWELKYGVSGLNPYADDDGDGSLNFQEAVAGTDPHDANSHPPMPTVTMANGAVTLTWKSVAGKAYRVQTSDTFATTASWSNLSAVMLSDGSDMTATFGVGASVKKYFRLVVTDFDSDGDGVNDWE